MKRALNKKISLQPDRLSKPAATKFDSQDRGVVPKISKQVRSPTILRWFRGGYSPGYNLAITIGGMVFVETMVMAVGNFYRSLPYYHQVILNAAVMTVIILLLRYL